MLVFAGFLRRPAQLDDLRKFRRQRAPATNRAPVAIGCTKHYSARSSPGKVPLNELPRSGAIDGSSISACRPHPQQQAITPHELVP